MSSNSLIHLSDQLGTIPPTTPDDAALALLAALRAARDADEVARFRSMLGLGGAK